MKYQVICNNHILSSHKTERGAFKAMNNWRNKIKENNLKYNWVFDSSNRICVYSIRLTY